MKIAVYCSAKNTIEDEYLRLGDALGTWIGEQGHTLVYGGATGGLMSRTSDSAQRSGAYIVGVIPPRIIKMGREAANCDKQIYVNDMAERKRIMREEADCFVCLPGGYGTLDEMFDVIAAGTVGEHNKPIFILNYKGYYRELEQLSQQMRELGFVPQQEAYKPLFVTTIDELIEAINRHNKL